MVRLLLNFIFLFADSLCSAVVTSFAPSPKCQRRAKPSPLVSVRESSYSTSGSSESLSRGVFLPHLRVPANDKDWNDPLPTMLLPSQDHIFLRDFLSWRVEVVDSSRAVIAARSAHLFAKESFRLAIKCRASVFRAYWRLCGMWCISSVAFCMLY
jgi:hypothetical protein